MSPGRVWNGQSARDGYDHPPAGSVRSHLVESKTNQTISGNPHKSYKSASPKPAPPKTRVPLTLRAFVVSLLLTLQRGH